MISRLKLLKLKFTRDTYDRQIVRLFRKVPPFPPNIKPAAETSAYIEYMSPLNYIYTELG
jgi:hypothetical protein